MVTEPSLPSDKPASRKRSWWGFLWRLVAISLASLLLLIGVTYVVWQVRGKALLRQEIALIPADEPFTTEELAAWYAMPAGTRDITSIWQTALGPFSDEFEQAIEDAKVPMISHDGEELSLAEPWDASEAVAFLEPYRNEIRAVYLATEEEGEVRYPRDFRDGLNVSTAETDRAMAASRALLLEFYILAQAADFEPLVANLRARLKLADTFRYEPNFTSLLTRATIHRGVLHNIRELNAHRELTDPQLVELQRIVRASNIYPQVLCGLLGERSAVYHAFHLNSQQLQAMGSQSPGPSVTTSRSGDGIWRAEDCAATLKVLRMAVAASRKPPEEMLPALDKARWEIGSLNPNHLTLTHFRYWITFEVTSGAFAFATESAVGGLATANITDALLASRRYHLRHRVPPTKHSDLTPDFLPADRAIDPFDGQPLRLRLNEGVLRIYSVSHNRKDDGGSKNPLDPNADLHFDLKLN